MARSTTLRSAHELQFTLEGALWLRGYCPVAGIDEAGRGALAGPVVAAAVILPRGSYPFRDSKQLGPDEREEMAAAIRACAVAWAVAEAEPAEVDALNVLEATRVASMRAVRALRVPPAALVTDYLELSTHVPVVAVARADDTSPSVAAASILAKVTRDASMRELDRELPGYGFASNKGYGSEAHLDALDRMGPSRIHRRTFRPVAQARLFP